MTVKRKIKVEPVEEKWRQREGDRIVTYTKRWEGGRFVTYKVDPRNSYRIWEDGELVTYTPVQRVRTKDGQPAHPYVIHTCEDLQVIAWLRAHPDECHETEDELNEQERRAFTQLMRRLIRHTPPGLRFDM